MKILLSAFTCTNGKASEPGNAWRVVNHLLDQGHEVWTITEKNGHEGFIMGHLIEHPMPRYHPIFFELSFPFTKLRSHGMVGNIYYYLWQRKLLKVARELHEKVGFDLAHHITYARCWMPSGVRNLGIPFIWGPVGAAEAAPASFLAELPFRERLSEWIRDGIRTVSYLDPALHDTARKATIALGTTRESCEVMRKLGARDAENLAQSGVSDEDMASFEQFPPPPAGPLRVLCLGRLVHWKGFYLAIRAFAAFAKTNSDAELWIVGEGPFRSELEKTTAQHGVTSRVRFLGSLPHAEAMEKLAQAHVLLHPALHEAFGNVCHEAMACGRPVVCLDIGGPAMQVNAETGFVAPTNNPEESIQEMAFFLTRIDGDRSLLAEMSAKARIKARKDFIDRKTGNYTIYARAVELYANRAKA